MGGEEDPEGGKHETAVPECRGKPVGIRDRAPREGADDGCGKDSALSAESVTLDSCRDDGWPTAIEMNCSS